VRHQSNAFTHLNRCPDLLQRNHEHLSQTETGADMVRRIGGRQGVQQKLLGLLEKPMHTYLIPAQVA
jgi:hypothetical protein